MYCYYIMQLSLPAYSYSYMQYMDCMHHCTLLVVFKPPFKDLAPFDGVCVYDCVHAVLFSEVSISVMDRHHHTHMYTHMYMYMCR